MISLNLNNSNVSSGAGIDVASVVEQILYAERAPERLWQLQQAWFTSQNSALDAIRTKVTDLASKVNSLKDSFGSLSAKIATSSQPAILTASAQYSASPGAHIVVVNSLATTASYYTDPLADGQTTFATGSFLLQVGTADPVEVTIDESNNTLDGLASYINQQDFGVSASVITDAQGARLALVSKASGQPGDLTISGNTSGLVFSKALSGSNAALTVDGVPISSDSNTVTNVLPGVTLNLLAGSPGTEVKLTIASDTEQAKSAINAFVDSYNAAIQAVNAQFSVDPVSHSGGPLASNNGLRSLQSALLSDATYSMSNNGFDSLASFGIKMANDGTLSVDSAKLDEVLAGNFAGLQNFFQSTDPGGFGSHFSASLDTLNDSTQGIIALNLNQITSTQTMLTKQINDFEDRLAAREKYLINEYSRVDAMLRQFPLLQAQITEQLSALTNS